MNPRFLPLAPTPGMDPGVQGHGVNIKPPG